MKTVQHLMNRYNKAAAALDEAKSELAPRLKEILQAMGEKVGRGDGLEECYISNSAVHCTWLLRPRQLHHPSQHHERD